MTNREAYMVYCNDGGRMLLSLEQYSIDPSLTDKTQVSSALGMIESSIQPDYKQGNTSETMPASSRKYLLARGKQILKDNGVEYKEVQSGNTINCYGI